MPSLLQEDGGLLLQENGSAILLDGAIVRWKPGQWVTLTSAQHGLADAQSRIVGVEWTWVGGEGQRRAVVRFGAGRLRLRSGGSLNTSGGSVQGEIG